MAIKSTAPDARMDETVCRIQFSERFSIFLRKLNGNLSIGYPISRNASIKDIIESFGVPHTEVGAIIKGGTPSDESSVSFDFVPRTASQMAIHPICAPNNVLSPSLLRPHPLKALRFIVDVNVGKLVSLLRMIGMDTVDSVGLSDAEIAEKAETEERVVLSKDIGLLKRKRITFGRYVRAVYPEDQLKEIVAFFGIGKEIQFFTRCFCCNALLQPIKKEKILHRLEPRTKKYYDHFKYCRSCDKVFWKGSHHESMEKRFRTIAG